MREALAALQMPYAAPSPAVERSKPARISVRFLCRLARDRGKLALDCLQRLSYVASSHRIDHEPVSALPSLQFPKRGREHGCLGRASDRAERLGRAVFDQLERVDYRGRF